MLSAPSKATINYDEKLNVYRCAGSWSTLYLDQLNNQFEHGNKPSGQHITVNGKDIKHFDSAGALTLTKCINSLKVKKNKVVLVEFNDHQNQLMTLIHEKEDHLDYHPTPVKKEPFLTKIGSVATYKYEQLNGLLVLIGNLSQTLYSALFDWRRFQFPTVVNTIYSAGITALPIIGLLSFLIGIVLAYQMGLQLETYGASIFIAFLSGMAIFREFAPLITAIIVAGRTSSAFTAQIGSMKINEEIDALSTMGLSPIELLVVPKIVGLILVFPLLIFWSSLFGILGAMIMSKAVLHVDFQQFLARLQESVGLKQMLLGLYKAPTFAVLIALVGCFQGFRVHSNADSLGMHTTKSVVQALFLIIVADAAYSIIYSWLDI